MPLDKELAKRILYEVDDLMDVEYFLICGTALGAYRDHDFIEYQFDIDLGCLAEILIPAIPRLMRKFLAAGYKITKVSKPMKDTRVIKVEKEGVKVDICSFWKHGEFRFNPNASKNYSIVQPAERFENLTRFKFKERFFMLPYPPALYLATEYGPDWRTPKEDGVSASRIYNFRRDNELF